MNPSNWPFSLILAAMLVAALVIAVFGVAMTRVARDLAHRTGLGEAFTGAVLIGAATSLSGITTSVAAAASGHVELSVSNAFGGIAAQTAFLAVADIFYRRANLEHAAASVDNLMLGAFLTVLLGVHLVAMAIPDASIGHLHPVSPVVVIAYIFGLYVLVRTHESPMWLPRRTSDTHPEDESRRFRMPFGLTGLWLVFAVCAVFVGSAGWVLAQVAVPFAEYTGLSEGFVGGTITAVATSLPELVIAITAVRMGALSLAVGDIVGGNAFDTLFIAVSDAVFKGGPIYAAVTQAESLWLAVALLMTGVLLMGLLFRERRGVGNIGLESVLLLVIYLGGASLIAWTT